MRSYPWRTPRRRVRGRKMLPGMPVTPVLPAPEEPAWPAAGDPWLVVNRYGNYWATQSVGKFPLQSTTQHYEHPVNVFGGPAPLIFNPLHYGDSPVQPPAFSGTKEEAYALAIKLAKQTGMAAFSRERFRVIRFLASFYREGPCPPI